MSEPISSYLRFVPSDPVENLRWRIRVRKAAMEDEELRAVLRQAAFDDPLFFFQAFMWCYDPRGTLKTIPFCIWPHQVPAILEIERTIDLAERRPDEPIDIVIDKSRAQGASVILLGIILRRWLRDDMFAAGLVSRNMEAVDSPTDPDSLMWKLDWSIKMLPWWMLPEKLNENSDRSLTKHAWRNPDNGSSIVGYAATGDVASGGRKTMFMFDEVAKFDPAEAQDAMNSTQYVTNCRVFVSTHKGDSGVYYDMVYGDAAGTKIILDWKDNPTQNRLLYRFRGAFAIALNLEDQPAVNAYIESHRDEIGKLKRRGFVKDGKLRSPWYDRQCLRKGVTPRSIAQELDRDPRGTVGKLFNTEVLDRMAKEQVREPVWEGKPTVVDGDLRLMPQEGGPLKLWFAPGLDDRPPVGKYVLGADIGTGSGGEWALGNSALVGANADSGEQILEYIDGTISETRFARLAVAMCQWLNDAMLIWEAQGPTGKRFATEVMVELTYPNIWRRPGENNERTAKAGWVNNRTNAKVDLFEDFWVAMDDEEFFPRSADLIKECGGWEWDEKGEKVIYRGQGHGDRAIAGGLCRKAMKDFLQIPLDNQNDSGSVVKYGTLAWRMEQSKRLQPDASHDGDGFTLRELLHVMN